METNPSSQTSRQWAMLAHLLSLLGYLLFLGHFLPPLVIWLTKRDEDEFVGDQAKESLNFQLTYLVAWVAAGLVIAAMVLSCVFAVVAVPLAWALGIALPIAHLVLVILAGLKASDGVRYRYPWTIRFL